MPCSCPRSIPINCCHRIALSNDSIKQKKAWGRNSETSLSHVSSLSKFEACIFDLFKHTHASYLLSRPSPEHLFWYSERWKNYAPKAMIIDYRFSDIVFQVIYSTWWHVDVHVFVLCSLPIIFMLFKLQIIEWFNHSHYFYYARIWYSFYIYTCVCCVCQNIDDIVSMQTR